MKIGEKAEHAMKIGEKSTSGRKIGAKADNYYGAVSNQTQVVLDPKVKEELMNRK
jgi:hypothetical protein